MLKKKILTCRYEDIEPQEGMYVRIINPEKVNPIMRSWFKHNKVDIDYAVRFMYRQDIEKHYDDLNTARFRIVAIGKLNQWEKPICLITRDDDSWSSGECWLIEEEGLELWNAVEEYED